MKFMGKELKVFDRLIVEEEKIIKDDDILDVFKGVWFDYSDFWCKWLMRGI